MFSCLFVRLSVLSVFLSVLPPSQHSSPADGVDFLPKAVTQIARYRRQGFNDLPICRAKTHLSLSADASKKG